MDIGLLKLLVFISLINTKLLGGGSNGQLPEWVNLYFRQIVCYK